MSEDDWTRIHRAAQEVARQVGQCVDIMACAGEHCQRIGKVCSNE